MPALRDNIETASFFEARSAQVVWGRVSVAERLKIVRRIRDGIAADAASLLDSFPQHLLRTRADSLSAEVIPLAEACRFLELRAERILAPRILSKEGRPLWLSRVRVEVRREPFGVVLVIGPSNCPLFLIGVQTLQALVAGNAVLVKPGRNGARVAAAFSAIAEKAGLPSRLITILDEEIESATRAIRSDIDKVVLTGSVESGRAVLRETAERLLPATVELSGHDAVFIQESADLERAVEAIFFGLNLNGGETCIAPRRVFVHESVAGKLRDRLAQIGSPVIPVTSFRNDQDALDMAAECPYGLGATVFGGESTAKLLAEKINAGVVVVNDMIVPTADPRVPFGGRGMSGFGTTRGAEGLLQMTVPKAVVIQSAKRLRHLEPVPTNAEELFLSYLSAHHRMGIRSRWRGWRSLLKAISQTRKVVR